MSIANKLEIDVAQAVELYPAVELALKHQMPALVVNQALMGQAGMALIKYKGLGRLKLICPVDWPKGETYSDTKFRGMTTACLAADGFEFLMTGGRSAAENANEANALTDFVRRYVSPTTEIRFILGSQLRPEAEVLQMAGARRAVPTPAMVRFDHHLKPPASKGNPTVHNQLYQQLCAAGLNFPLKISGNIATVKAVTSCSWAARYAVSLGQAQSIIRELQRQPEELQELLNLPINTE